jgi:predicted membrane channel-forming protein YqfA (hemolysin III family)
VHAQTYPGRGLSRTSLILSVAVLAWLGVLTVVALVVGGAARFLSLLTGLGMVVAIGVLVYRMAKAGGSLKVTRELMAFGGERIYFRDIEGVERGLPDRGNQTFRVEVRTRERVHHLDLMAFRMEPEAMPALLEELQREVAQRRGAAVTGSSGHRPGEVQP